jgi:hypothetical protein
MEPQYSTNNSTTLITVNPQPFSNHHVTPLPTIQPFQANRTITKQQLQIIYAKTFI